MESKRNGAGGFWGHAHFSARGTKSQSEMERRMRLFQEFRPKKTGTGERLFVLPGRNLLRIARKQDIRNFPSIENSRTRIDRRSQQTILERIGQRRSLVPQRTRQQPDDGIRHDGRRKLAATEHIIPHRDLPRNQMLADTVVHPLVMPTENHQVFLTGKLIRHLLRKRFAIRRRKDNLIVRPLRLELLHERKDRLDHHHHARITPETVVIHLPPAPLAVFTNVVDMDFNEPFVTGTLDDGVAERTLEQFRNDR